ncbi:MAG: molybdenum cofactor guanylyltransferase [Chloroflexota bacterium]|nr:molybdenum cofactor guanylyltransferase [Chloroflexota bacterium]
MGEHNLVTTIILAGGESSRFGKNKALVMVDGKSLVQRVVERVMPISCQIIVAGSLWQPGFPSTPDIEYKPDLYPDKGPLGGIYTGLSLSKSFYNIVVACDMPFLNIELLRYMVKLCPGFDAVVPFTDRIQPLHGVYAKSCLDSMRIRLENHRLGIARFLNMVNVRHVTKEECQQFDPDLSSFYNINSETDLGRANMLATNENVSQLSY